ncbi:unnamed protein product [Laminaria digitata]
MKPQAVCLCSWCAHAALLLLLLLLLSFGVLHSVLPMLTRYWHGPACDGSWWG